MLALASVEQELHIIASVAYKMLCWPFRPYDQSLDNCSKRRQS